MRTEIQEAQEARPQAVAPDTNGSGGSSSSGGGGSSNSNDAASNASVITSQKLAITLPALIIQELSVDQTLNTS